MTPTQILKNVLNKLELDFGDFEEALNLQKGTLKEPCWDTTTINTIYLELKILFDWTIPELEIKDAQKFDNK